MENVLKKQNDKRAEAIEKIVADNEIRELVSHSEMGDRQAIETRFHYLDPELGGCADVASNPEWLEEATGIIDLKIEEANESGNFVDTSSWDLYADAAREVRKENMEFDDEGKLFREPPVSVDDDLQLDRQAAVEQMAFDRNQGIGD